MTTRELQEYWQNEKCRWKPVKLLFEIASARIEEKRLSKFVVSQDGKTAELSLSLPHCEVGSHTHTNSQSSSAEITKQLDSTPGPRRGTTMLSRKQTSIIPH